MIDHRPLSALPSANFGWLKARHHFPVNGLPDPVHKPVKSLYVWNDDQIAPGGGFPLHHHRDVEIITYVRSGAVTHQDTLGNTYDIQAGDVQVMSTGAGLRHAEANRGNSPLKLYQIWLEPRQAGLQHGSLFTQCCVPRFTAPRERGIESPSRQSKPKEPSP